MRRLLAMLTMIGASLAAGAEVPRPSPEFTVNLPDGKQIKLSQYKGKVVVVEFLLVTCPHCQKTSAVLAKLQREYAPKGVQMIGVSIDPKADAGAFARQYGATYPVGTAPTRESVYAYLQHSLMSPTFYVPQLIVIDRNGVIREQHDGTDPYFQNEEANIRASIDKALAQGNAGAAKKPAAPAKTRKRASSAS